VGGLNCCWSCCWTCSLPWQHRRAGAPVVAGSTPTICRPSVTRSLLIARLLTLLSFVFLIARLLTCQSSCPASPASALAGMRFGTSCLPPRCATPWSCRRRRSAASARRWDLAGLGWAESSGG
jgi:hypothetical protein